MDSQKQTLVKFEIWRKQKVPSWQVKHLFNKNTIKVHVVAAAAFLETKLWQRCLL